MLDLFLNSLSVHVSVVFLPIYYVLMDLIFADIGQRAAEIRSKGAGFESYWSEKTSDTITEQTGMLLLENYLKKTTRYRRKLGLLMHVVSGVGLLFTILGLMAFGQQGEPVDLSNISTGLSIALTSTALSTLLYLTGLSYILLSLKKAEIVEARLKETLVHLIADHNHSEINRG